MKRALLCFTIFLIQFSSILGQDLAEKPFGHIDDSYAVNSAGAYNHIIPIYMPPGVNGLVPNLSLIYDSRSGISELGYGWALSGLSKITRSGNRFVQSSKTKNITFTSEDIFLLDGQYMGCMEGPNGGSNSRYRTENESFSIIWSNGSASVSSNSSPKYFVVKQANGLTYYYGAGGQNDFSNDARLLVKMQNGTEEVLEWHIKKIKDSYGNYIEFEYRQNSLNAIRIESISYTGNENINLAPANKIVFRYCDPITGISRKNNINYINGVPFKNENLLKSIGIMTNGFFFKYYHFKYDAQKSDLLTSISESSDELGERHLPETNIIWTNKDTVDFTGKEHTSYNVPENLLEIDLNLDGRKEYVSFKKNPPGDQSPFSNRPPFSNNLEIYTQTIQNNVVEYKRIYELAIKTESGSDIDLQKYIFADVNSDNLPDLISENFIYLNNTNGQKIDFSPSTESHVISQSWRRNEQFVTGAMKKGNGCFLDADLDGNGQKEIIAVDKTQKELRIYELSNDFYYEIYKSTDADLKNIVAKKLDIMGAGKEELILIAPNKLDAKRIFIENKKIKTEIFKLPSSLAPASSHLIDFFDFNGDGILDVYLDIPGEKLKIWINTGNGFINEKPFETPFIFSVLKNAPKYQYSSFGNFTSEKYVQILNFNGDDYTLWNTIYEKENNLIFEPVSLSIKLHEKLKLGEIQFLDLDNDGDLDIKWQRKSAEKTNDFQYFINPNNFQNKISSIVDGLGNEVHVQYSFLEDTTVYNCNQEKLKNNYSYYCDSYQMVKELQYSNGLPGNAKNSIKYQYENLIYEKTGRGLSGFKVFSQKEKGITTQTEYEYNFPLTGKILSQVEKTDNNIELYRLENKWSFQLYDSELQLLYKNDYFVDKKKPESLQDLKHNTLNSKELYIKLSKNINKTALERDYPGFFKNKNFHADPSDILKAVGSFNYSKKTYIPLLLNSLVRKKELDGSEVSYSQIYYQYDDFGYLKKTEQILGGSTHIVNIKENLHINSNLSEGAPYRLGLVIADSSYVYKDSYDDQNNQKKGIRTNHYSYNPSTGALEERIRQKGNLDYQHNTSFKYDNTGNIISKYFFKNSPELETHEEYIYSNDRRFVEMLVNPLGYKTRYEYDFRYGKKTLEIDLENQLPIKNIFDDFGNLVKTEYPDSRSISYKYDFLSNTEDTFFAPEGPAYYKITTTESGSEPTISYRDKLQREIASIYSLIDEIPLRGTNGVSGFRRVIKAQKFDEYGNLAIDYKPFYISNAQLSNSSRKGYCIETYSGQSVYNFMERYDYDILKRPIAMTLNDGLELKIENAARKKIKHNANNQTSTNYYNLKGEIITVADDQNNHLNYEYDLWGNVTKIISPDGHIIECQYDLIGRKIKQIDPSYGTTEYKYDAYDRIIEEKKGQRITSLSYDKLNRLIKRATKEGTTRWSFDSQIKGKADRITDAEGNVTTYQYDKYARIIAEEQTIRGEKFSNKFTYDKLGRVDTRFFPKGYAIKYHYVNNIVTKISEIRADNTLKPIWEISTLNSEGKIAESKSGNGLKTSYDFNPYNNSLNAIILQKAENATEKQKESCNPTANDIKEFYNYPVPYQRYEPFYEDDLYRVNKFIDKVYKKQSTVRNTSANPNILQHLVFEYDNNYNINIKTDYVNKDVKGYVYDNLNRLTRVLSPGSNQTLSIKYDINGNILSKSDTGLYQYDDTKLQQLNSISKDGKTAFEFIYDNYGNVISEKTKGLNITYTSFDKPISISNSSEKSEFRYGYDNQQVEVCYFKNGATEKVSITPFSDFEIEKRGNKETYLNYIMLGSNLIAIHYQDLNSEYNHYIHKDHLGSIQLITDDSGQKVVEYQYTAFGQRSLLTGNGTTIAKGFTGHQHLDDFGLINASARLYSPLIGRFLSADPFVQSPNDLQSLNRYSYVSNNPVNNTDPTGFWGIKIKAPRIKWNPARDISRGINNIGRAVGKAHEDIYNEGDRFIDKNGKQIVVVAAAVAITYFSGGMASGLAGAMIQGAVFGASMRGGMTVAYGGNFQDVLNSAFKGAYTGAASAAVFYGIGSAFEAGEINTQFGSSGYYSKTVAHGLAGGLQSDLQGGDFKNGFLGASISHAFSPMTENLFSQQDQVFQRVAYSGALGGLAAYATGGDVAMGFTTAAYSRWFNCESHKMFTGGISVGNVFASASATGDPALGRQYGPFGASVDMKGCTTFSASLQWAAVPLVPGIMSVSVGTFAGADTGFFIQACTVGVCAQGNMNVESRPFVSNDGMHAGPKF